MSVLLEHLCWNCGEAPGTELALRGSEICGCFTIEADGDFEKVGQIDNWDPLGACTRRPNQFSNRSLESPDSHLHIDPIDLMTCH